MRLVYLSPIPWASFAQRSHHFVAWFHARTSDDVLWVDPYPTRLPAPGDFGRSARRGASESFPTWMKVLRPAALPIEPLPGSGSLNGFMWRGVLDAISTFAAAGPCQIGVGKPSELALRVLARTKECAALYDAMDDFPAFYSGLSRQSMQRKESDLAQRVDKIIVSSSRLREKFAAYESKVSLALNACAVEALPAAESLSVDREADVLGYVGTIGPWFDWPLVCAIAEHNPALQVRLIGPVYTPSSTPLPINITLRPACSHASAIKAMQQFSVGLIPFRLNALTGSVDPIKYYEYRALGLPVLSTRFGEMAVRNDDPGVFLMDGVSDFSHVVGTAMSHEFNLSEVQSFRNANSWQARFDAIGILP